MKLLKVNETKTRSLVKAISFRIVEITADTLLLTLVFGLAIHHSLMASIGIEFMCFCLHYVAERLWNQIHWGREIK